MSNPMAGFMQPIMKGMQQMQGMMQQMPQMQQMQNPMAQNFSQQTVNPAQFKQFLPQINDNILNQIMNQARAQGINESDISAGLKFINSMR